MCKLTYYKQKSVSANKISMKFEKIFIAQAWEKQIKRMHQLQVCDFNISQGQHVTEEVQGHQGYE